MQNITKYCILYLKKKWRKILLYQCRYIDVFMRWIVQSFKYQLNTWIRNFFYNVVTTFLINDLQTDSQVLEVILWRVGLVYILYKWMKMVLISPTLTNCKSIREDNWPSWTFQLQEWIIWVVPKHISIIKIFARPVC